MIHLWAVLLKQISPEAGYVAGVSLLCEVVQFALITALRPWSGFILLNVASIIGFIWGCALLLSNKKTVLGACIIDDF